MPNSLKYSKEEQLEEESRVAFRSRLPSNFLARDIRDRDKGVDMEIEIAEGEDLTGNRLLIQLKSTTKEFKSNPSYSFETKHLQYWEKNNLPVIIVLGLKTAEGNFDFYYLFVQEFIFNDLQKQKPLWWKQKYINIEFPLKLMNIEETFTNIALEGFLIIASNRLSALNPNGALYFQDGIPHSDNQELKRLTAIALDFLMKENYPEAIVKLEYILSELILSPTEKMSIFLNLGNAYLTLGQLDKAKENYKTIITQKGRINKENALRGEAAALGNIGLIFQDQGKYDEAMEHHQAALAIHRELGHRQGEANQLGNIGIILLNHGKYDEAMEHYQAALAIDRELGYRQGEAVALGNIGLVFQDQGKYDEAMEHHQAALAIDLELGHRQGEAADLVNIGLVLYNQKKYEEAKEHCQAALTIFKELNLGNEIEITEAVMKSIKDRKKRKDSN